MATVSESNVAEIAIRCAEFMWYADREGKNPSPALSSERLEEMNAQLAMRGLAETMQHVVVDGRNAILYKGPEAAAYQALHEDSDRCYAEFLQSDFYKQMKTQQETYEAKIRAGLFTVQELNPGLFTAEEKNTLSAPKICEIFTAEELDPLKNFTCADHHKTLDDLLKEGARRLRQVEPNTRI